MPFGSEQWMYASGADFTIDQSLRFNDDDSAYLSKTLATPTNNKKWTYSCWTKRGNLGSYQYLIDASASGSQERLYWANDDTLVYNTYIGSTDYIKLITSAVFRDTSAWYNIVLSVDTTQGTAANRVKLYVNGSQLTSFSTETQPSLNYDTKINSAVAHRISSRTYDNASPLDGYLAEVHFIDGTALTPTSFGETGTYGEWKPKQVAGLTYGTNGFYLPFKQDYTVEGFSATTYTGNGSGQYIGGVGFQPDLTWFKRRDASTSHAINDSVRGIETILTPNSTAAEVGGQDAGDDLLSWETDGFLLGANGTSNSHDRNNGSGNSYIVWNWDMGGSNATNTSGTITSTVRANATYGQSIVSWSGNGTSNATIGHGLSGAPEMVICKRRNNGTDQWAVYHASLGQGFLQINTTDAYSSATDRWGTNAPTSSVMNLGHAGSTNNGSGTYIAYMFDSVAGYSSIGSYTGNGNATGTVVTFASGGFKPAFLLIKPADAVDHWNLYDNTRDPTNPNDTLLFPNRSNAEGTGQDVDFLSDGFQLKTDNTGSNGSGTTYIYMAFADKREYAYWLDQSGNNNDWTSNNLTESDISVDSPTNNFATLNPLSFFGANKLAEGNLQIKDETVGHRANSGTMFGSSGKWYFEALVKTSLAGSTVAGGIGLQDSSELVNYASGPDMYGYYCNNNSARLHFNGGGTGARTLSTDGTHRAGAGDILQCAYDVDTRKLFIGLNNSWIANDGGFDGNPATGANPTNTLPTGIDFLPYIGSYNNVITANFGQDSSFAGNKTAQGNQDGNDIGDFYYTPPTDYLALCTSNLPAVAVIPSEHFNTVLWTGDGTDDRGITGVGFQSDFTWIKGRNTTEWHHLYDAVRGANKGIYSLSTLAEESLSDTFESFDSDGFTVGYNASYSSVFGNKASTNYVAWNWKANGSGVTNTAGSVDSTVSVNTDAGFSIVSYTGNATSGATIGHGLSVTPEMIIVKERGNADSWAVYHTSMGNTKLMHLDQTLAERTHTTYWNDTSPTSSVFSVGSDNKTNGNNAAGMIAYCFHSVDGYSKVGSYTGNSSTDGTFVYTGFRPAFLMIKGSSNGGHWAISNNKSTPYNVINKAFISNDSAAEYTDPAFACLIDYTSNGFKWRNSDDNNNFTGRTYIYIAFAETPFKYSNAR